MSKESDDAVEGMMKAAEFVAMKAQAICAIKNECKRQHSETVVIRGVGYQMVKLFLN